MFLTLASDSTTIGRDYVLLFSAYSAGVGWCINLYYTTKNQRKQHTINVLLSHTRNSIYHGYAKKFLASHPPDDESIIELDKTLEDKELKESIRYILNEYEFISAAIKRKDLDYCLMKDTIRLQLCTAYRKCLPLVKHFRKEAGDKTIQVGAERPRLYIHLMDLYEDWSKEDYNGRT